MDSELTPKEQRVIDAIDEVMNAIRDLYDGNPHNFVNEAVPAIHVLQKFALMHWANRLNPYWSDWVDHEPSRT